MSNINWEMVSAIVGIATLIIVLLLDWDKIVSRVQGTPILARLATRIGRIAKAAKRYWKTIGLLLGLLTLEYVRSQLSLWSVGLFAFQLLLLLGLVLNLMRRTTPLFVLAYDFIDRFGEATLLNETHKIMPVEKALSRRPGGTEMRAIWAHPGYPDRDTEVNYELPAQFLAAHELILLFAVAVLGEHPLEERQCGFENRADNRAKFEVRVNGKTVFERVFSANDPNLYEWEPHAVTVTPTTKIKQRALKVALVTNAMGDTYYNWTAWGEPRLIAGFHVGGERVQ